MTANEYLREVYGYSPRPMTYDRPKETPMKTKAELQADVTRLEKELEVVKKQVNQIDEAAERTARLRDQLTKLGLDLFGGKAYIVNTHPEYDHRRGNYWEVTYGILCDNGQRFTIKAPL